MEEERRYVSLTISSVVQGRQIPDRVIEALAKWVKRMPSDVRHALENKKIKIGKVQITDDLEKTIAILQRKGLQVEMASLEDGEVTLRTRFDASMGATGRVFGPEQTLQKQTDWKKGDVIEGLYEVLGSAAGGMGRVYFVFHRLWKMMLAIKTPLREFATTDTRIRRFLREAELWVNLGLHPNIATCYYARLIEGLPRLFIEYVDGGALDVWHEKKRLTDRRIVTDLMLQFCHGMLYAEESGIIHRDIKPANCLITKDGVLKVTDFGLVKRVSSETVETLDLDGHPGEGPKPDADPALTVFEGGVVGSPWYMAPERFTENAREDIRSDIYSFGVMLYELSLDHMPFSFPAGFSLSALLRSHMKARPTDPISIDPALPRTLADIILRCLEKKPEDRYRSFGEVSEDLEKLSRELRPTRPPRSRPSLLALKADSLNNQAVSLLDLGRDREALALLQDACSANTDHLEAVYNLHTLRWQRAEASDREVLKHMGALKIEARETPDYAHLLGLIGLQRGDPAPSVKLLEKAAEESAFHQASWSSRGASPRAFVKSLGLTPVGELASFAGHVRTALAVAFAPGSLRAFSVGEDRCVRIWDVASGRCLKIVKTFNFSPVAGAFSPDGRLAATAYGDAFKTLDLWDLEQGQLLLRYKGFAAQRVAFSPDSRLVAALGPEGLVRIMDASSEEVLFEFQDRPEGLSSLAFLLDGDSLALGGGDGSLSLRLFRTGEEVFRVKTHEGPITGLDVSLDRMALLTAGADETVRMWDVNTGEEIRRFIGHRAPVTDVSFTPDAKHVVSTARDRTIKIWDSGSGRCYRTLTLADEELVCCAISTNAKRILSGGSKGSVRLWSLDTGWFLPNFLEPAVCRPKTFVEMARLHYAFQRHVEDFRGAWDRSDKDMALQAFERVRNAPGFCWSTEAIKARSQVARDFTRGPLNAPSFIRAFQGHGKAVTGVAAGADSLTLLSGGLDGLVVVWDVVTGKAIRRFDAGAGVGCVQFFPDGLRILTWTVDKRIRVWDLEGRVLLKAADVNRPVRVSQNGDEIVGVARDNTPVTIDAASGERRARGPAIQGSEFISFSENLETLFSLREGRRILRWSVDSGRNQGAFRDLGLNITCALPAAADDVVAAGAETGELMLYLGLSGMNVKTLRGHTGPVRTLAGAPSGDLWLTGADDCSLRLWEGSSEKCLAVLEGHSSPVSAACFFPNLCMAASAGVDGSIRLWGLEWDFRLEEIDRDR